MHSNRLLHWSKIHPPALVKEKKRDDGERKTEGGREREEEGEWERDGDGGKRRRSERGREGERKVKNLHITMPEKNQNIFHRKMGHFQILVPYQTN